MTITVEDGTGVADANSYITTAEGDEYALRYGVTVTGSDPEKEVLIAKAMAYLETFRYRFTGVENDPGDQALSWPRTNAYLNGSIPIADDDIPSNLIAAQSELYLQAFNGVDFMPISGLPGDASDARYVKREKIGPIETEYSDALAATVSGGGTVTLPLFWAYLQPLLVVAYGIGTRIPNFRA